MMARDPDSSQRKSHDPPLDQSGFAVERLPMLGVIFDDVTTGLVEGLRQLCRAPTAFSVEEIAASGLTLAKLAVAANLLGDLVKA